ncbi:IS3 family transposase [Streptomyces sp. NPDC058632]|uniref:IS3 family transposase n=1 Tax=Streptomyces sp. NPDC058632 TaxID=3346567 RepID=UPI0036659F83
MPDPQVEARSAGPRRYTAEYKARVLAEYETLDKKGKGALLRREGLYSSLITTWRQQRDKGGQAALAAPAGRPRADPRDREIAKLKAEKARLEADLAKARTVIEVQGKTLRAARPVRHGQRPGPERREHQMTGATPAAVFDTARDQALEELTPLVGRVQACAALGVSRATYYRHHRRSPAPARPRQERRRHPRALTPEEEIRVLDVLHSPEFADMAPAEIYAILLDRGVYLCSESTMYRLLRRHGEVRERRRQAVHPPRTVPELLAEGPNQVWSWDITKLKGPVKGVYYCLYTIIDIFSRYTAGWMIAAHENKDLAERFLSETIAKYGIEPGQLTIHSDRGSPMVAQNVAQRMAGLGVTKSHSRPKTSNDNPYSESQYKTLKYRHDFPGRFGSLEDARAWCTRFFTWYNEEHRHSGIGLHTPYDIHFGLAEQLREMRADILQAVYAKHPERFVRKPPEPPTLPAAAWINKPAPDGPLIPAQR